MVRYGWRTREEDGLIMVYDLPDGAEHAPMLAPADAKILDAVEARWGELCRAAGAHHGLPDGWLQAMIYRESGGNPRARNQEGTPDPANDGIGLLQITSRALKGHRTDEQLFDPATNVDIGARYVAELARRYGFDFPKVAAAFNAGSVKASDANPWGMVQTTGHVSGEVAALNTWTARYFMPDDYKANVLASVWQTSSLATDAFTRGGVPPEPDPAA